MTQEIIPDRQTVQSCLSKKTYFVDFYQREYVWSKNTVDILLRDIFYAFEISYEEHKDEELTEEVLELYNWYYMNVFITNKVNSKVYIVDGQQRTITFSLLLTAEIDNTHTDCHETLSPDYRRDIEGSAERLYLYKRYV